MVVKKEGGKRWCSRSNGGEVTMKCSTCRGCQWKPNEQHILEDERDNPSNVFQLLKFPSAVAIV